MQTITCAKLNLILLILLPPDKFQEILSIAKNFPGNVTSFLGFEIHLRDTTQRADWAFAVSGDGSDREGLVNLMKNGQLPQQFLQQPEWRHIAEFSKHGQIKQLCSRNTSNAFG